MPEILRAGTPRRRHLRRTGVAAAMIPVAAIFLTACGSSGAKTASGGTSSGSTTTASCVAKAKAAVAAAQKAPSVPTIASVAAKSVAGKKVWFVKPGSTAFTDAVADGFVAAAKAAGLDPTVQGADRSVTNMNNIVQQAATQKVDALVLFSIDTPLVSQPLATLQAAKKPIVSVLSTGSQAPNTDVYARVDVDGPREGKLMADWILVDSNCSASIATIDVPTYSFVHSVIAGGQKEIADLCPDCKQYKSEAAIATQATDIQRNVQVAMQAHPEIGYILSPYDAAQTYVNAGLANVTAKPKVLAMTGTLKNLQEVAGSGPQAVDFSWAPADYIGWATVNKVLQALTGAEGKTDVLPDELFDKTNVGNGQNLFPGLNGFQDQFKKAWGIS